MLESIIEAARQAGAIMLQAESADKDVHSKLGSATDVTKYDVAVQEYLEDVLGRIMPEAGFLGEENGETVANGAPWQWIVDPIDGTTNFIHQYHQSAVSIALAHEGEAQIGVIYQPYTDELFTAQRGKGACLNGKPIHVSHRPLSEGLVGFGTTPYQREKAGQTFRLAHAIYLHAADVRRSGSAAVDLCSVAAGRMELNFELILQPWDYAAASVILTEAGGCISRIDGKPFDLYLPSSILAGNQEAYQEFFRLGLDRI